METLNNKPKGCGIQVVLRGNKRTNKCICGGFIKYGSKKIVYCEKCKKALAGDKSL